jgi:K+-transporting ATPase ATPase C chain
MQHLRANLWLLVLTLLACSLLYPLVLWGIGQTVFPDQANGSIITDNTGRPVGSRLIGQPFSKDEYFQPRPSAAGGGNGYNAAASGASNWGASNYQLRDRVARALGPVVTYKSGPNAGKKVGPDVEAWFREKDKQLQAEHKGGLVAQWAQAHEAVVQNQWIKADKLNGAYVEAWQKEHPDEVAAWQKEHPDLSEPKPEDLAVPFFTSYSKAHPGTFPSAVEHPTADGKTEKRIEPATEGSDIQATFFEMWRQDHPDADLELVPADMVMASGSGLDPDITLKNAEWQLENRVAEAWAKRIKGDPDKAPAAQKERVTREVGQQTARIKDEIKQMLNERASAPLGGLAGVKLINVLEINLALRDRYEPRTVAAK